MFWIIGAWYGTCVASVGDASIPIPIPVPVPVPIPVPQSAPALLSASSALRVRVFLIWTYTVLLLLAACVNRCFRDTPCVVWCGVVGWGGVGCGVLPCFGTRYEDPSRSPTLTPSSNSTPERYGGSMNTSATEHSNGPTEPTP